MAKSNAPNKRQQQLRALLVNIQLLAFDAEAASQSALLRAALEAQGTPIGPVDTLIAGTALAAGGTLVTRNTRVFSRVEGLQVVDWY